MLPLMMASAGSTAAGSLALHSGTAASLAAGSGGLGILGAASAAMPYIAVASAVIGGTLGFLSAQKTNKTIRKNLVNNYQAIDKATLENRTQFYDTTEVRSKQAADEIAQVSQALAGFGSGLSNTEYLTQVQNDKVSDQSVMRSEYVNQQQNFMTEKQNAYAQAKSQTVNPFMGIISGAMQGLGAGAALGGAVKGGAESLMDNNAMTTFAQDWNENGATEVNLARASALNAGVQARYLVNGNDSNPYLAPFLYKLQGDAVTRASIENSLTISNANLDVFRQMNQIPLQNYNNYDQSRFLGPKAFKQSQQTNQLLKLIRGY